MDLHGALQANRRITVLACLFIIFGLLIVGRLFYVQTLHAQDYLAQANAQQSRKFEISARRGEIYVQDSTELYPVALNQRLHVLAIDPKYVNDPNETANKLATFAGQSASEVADKIKSSNSRYIELKQKLSSEEADKIRSLGLPGVILAERDYRYYPEGSLLAHVLGYVNADGDGQYGLEEYVNDDLKGKPGQLKAVTDSLGVPISSTENTAATPVDGKSYVLTIDRKVQSLAHDALAKAVTDNKAEGGSVIVMDPKNGAIRAMASYPDYDPNNYTSVTDYKTFINSAVSNLYEPGSGFKVITMASGINEGTVKADTKYNDTGELTISGKTIKNAEEHKFGIQTMTDVIQKSLNTGAVFVLQSLGTDPNKITAKGKEMLSNYITKFGFGQRTGIEQANEANSKIKAPNAPDVDYANITFGQGISVTSIQMISAVAAIANGGKLYQPHLIDETIDSSGQTQKTSTKVVNNSVISSQAAATVAQMMTQVVQHGSGYLTRTSGYTIAGKTGTAQVPKPDGSGYEENKNIGSFVGFAPVEDPQFVILVRVDYPKVSGFAESTAVPAFATIARELFSYYHIPPNNQPAGQ